MKKGEKKKQAKALAKRTERKSAKKAQQVAAAEGELRPIRQARKYPLEGCWVQSGWQEAGLAVVVVARRQPNGLLVFGNYLVDYYCLGVKSAFARADVTPSIFYERLPELLSGETPTPIAPALAHELIYGSLEYAAGYGFRPDPDFALAQLVLDPPEALSAHRSRDLRQRWQTILRLRTARQRHRDHEHADAHSGTGQLRLSGAPRQPTRRAGGRVRGCRRC